MVRESYHSMGEAHPSVPNILATIPSPILFTLLCLDGET
jgi:hypothetical protein